MCSALLLAYISWTPAAAHCSFASKAFLLALCHIKDYPVASSACINSTIIDHTALFEHVRGLQGSKVNLGSTEDIFCAQYTVKILESELVDSSTFFLRPCWDATCSSDPSQRLTWRAVSIGKLPDSML